MGLLTSEQMDRLRGLHAAGAVNNNYSHIYEQIAEWLEGNPAADPVRLWFKGAQQANGGYGPFSTLIRTYTLRQAELRGVSITDAIMQEASNLVATRVIDELLKEKELSLKIIAENDASAVGEVAFKGLGTDTASGVNAAWSGAILFKMLGRDESGRLHSVRDAERLDVLDDWKNAIIAYDAFAEAIRAIGVGWKGYGSAVSIFFELPDQSLAQLLGDINENIVSPSDHELGPRLATLFQGTPLAPVFGLIGHYGVPEVLNMLFSAYLGYPTRQVTGQNYAASFAAFFSQLTPEQTQALGIDFIGDRTATELQALAMNDVRVRNALSSLSLFALDPLDGRAAELALLDERSGEGAITAEWIAARSTFLTYLGIYREDRDDDGVVDHFAIPGADLLFKARGDGTDIDLRVDRLDLGMAAARRIHFGGGSNDLLVGGDGGDRLFGEGGDDSLSGGNGDDHLEGGVGDDTLKGGDGADILIGMGGNDLLIGGDGNDRLEGGMGFDRYELGNADEPQANQHDSIYDLDGAGEVVLGGLVLGRLSRIGADAWESSDGRFRALRRDSNGATTLSIVDIRTSNIVDVQRWQQGQLGLHLEGLGQAFTPDPANTATMWDGDRTPSGTVPVNGVFAGDAALPRAYYTGFGEDLIHAGSGMDYINGGPGSDIIDAGDGNDVIVEVAKNVRRPSYWQGSAPAGVELAKGLGFIIHMHSGVQDDARTYYHDLYTGIVTANSPSLPGGITLPDAEQYADGGDIIDAGAGSDIVMSGEGNDIVDGGSGNDVIFGGHDNDLLLGGGGDDLIRGDLVDGVLAESQFENLSSSAVHDGNDQIDGGEGDDEIHGDGGDDQIWGGSGNDIIVGDAVALDVPRQGSDALHGGEGDDRIWGGAGDDLIEGDDGDDVIYGDFTVDQLGLQHHGNDVINGGRGMDHIDGQGGSDRIDGGEGADILIGGAGDDVIHGGTGNDSIHGDSSEDAEADQGNDAIDAGDGDDVVLGMGGHDVLSGGDGDDTLFGDDQFGTGNGNDLLIGGRGNDHLHGGSGNDELQGGAGNDTLIGGQGHDRILIGRGEGHDIVQQLDSPEAGDDVIQLMGMLRADAAFVRRGDALLLQLGPGQSVTLEGFFAATGSQHRIEFADGTSLDRAAVLDLVAAGSAGPDHLVGGNDNDELHGADGNDRLEGGIGSDTLYGEEGDDTLLGDDGNDVLVGGTGNDLLDGGAGDDTLDGGAGSNTYRHAAGSGQDVIRSSAPDEQRMVQLTGYTEPSAMSFNIRDGSLTIAANDHDSLTIGKYAGAGSIPVTILWADGREVSPEEMLGGDNILHIFGYDDLVVHGHGGDDQIWAGYGNDLLHGDEGNDKLIGELGDDILHGGSGNDVIYGDTRVTVSSMEHPSSGDDRLHGGEGDDSLYGSGGNDWLQGDAGNDYLFGGWGGDTLIGGTGDDTLWGGGDNDTYLFSRGHGVDTITEYQFNIDTDRVVFDATVNASEYIVVRESAESDDLHLINRVSGDRVIIFQYFSPRDGSISNRVDVVEFADGTVWTAEDLDRMASQGTDFDDNLLYRLAPGNFIDGGAGNDEIRALSQDDMLLGGDGNDIVFGGAGNDILEGGAGTDLLSGEAGSDVYRFGSGSGLDFIVNGIREAGDLDVIEVSADVQASQLALARSGNALVLTLPDTDDRLVVFNQFGGGGNTEGSPVDAIRFADGTLWDQAAIDAHIGSDLPAISLVYEGRHYAYDGDGTTYLIGSKGSQGSYQGNRHTAYYLDPGKADRSMPAGSDHTLVNGGGLDDIYVFGRGYGALRLSDEGGRDTLRFNPEVTTTDVTLTRFADDLVVGLTGGDEVGIPGYFAGRNAIESLVFADGSGWSSADIARRVVAGDQTLVGTTGDDVLAAGDGNDDIRGLAGNDVLHGGDREDLLDGGEGADIMHGGAGSDTYIVDDVGDVVIDSGPRDFGEREINTVRARIDYTLGERLHRLILERGGLVGRGNMASNVLIGSAGADTLYATAEGEESWEADWFDGGDGNDLLIGGLGGDTLIGGAGDDVMRGGGGSDLYYVDSAGDVVIELNDEGDPDEARWSSVVGSSMSQVPGEHPWRSGDTVMASIDYTLQDNVESLVLLDNAQRGTGNAQSNALYGNAGDNTLSGLDGDDRLIGNAGNDLLLGGVGDDELEGGAGNDRLVGGEGDDRYVFAGGHGQDVIDTFDSGGRDELELRLSDGEAVSFRRNGDSLDVRIGDGQDQITVEGWYAGPDRRLDGVRIGLLRWFSADDVEALAAGSGGDASSRNQVDQLVHALAHASLVTTGAIAGSFLPGHPLPSMLFAAH